MTSLSRLPFLVFLALCVVLPLRQWVAVPITIVTASMEPTLHVGSLKILDKWSLLMRKPRRGEIIIFKSPVEDIEMGKRVIGIPGDTVELRAKKVFVNDLPLDEPYTVYHRANQLLEGDNLGPITVPKDSYFMLGDNRDESNDSTMWKDSSGERIYFVKKSALRGVVRSLPWAG